MKKEDKKQKKLERMRHSAAHVLAQAVLDLYPDAKLGIGPAIEDGFYYDFDVKKTFTPGDLKKIEKRMREIVNSGAKFEQRDVSKAEAKKLFKDQPYKLELTEELPEGKVSIYKDDSFEDLCAGPHVGSTDEVGAFKLTHAAGAYWKGDEKRPMLQRIYGVAFETKEELEKHLAMLEEAKKRDHRKIGKALDLFSFHPESPGGVFWHPKGLAIVNAIIDWWREEHRLRGYHEVSTPMITSKSLYETSGHWKLYKESMFAMKIGDEDYALKPMNCPSELLIFKEKLYSYRELPYRMNEIGIVHRKEASGELTGLLRVNKITMDDAHLFVTPEQLDDELNEVLEFIFFVLGTFGFKEFELELTLRDPAKPEKYLGDDAIWEMAVKALRDVLEKRKLDYVEGEGEAKFYGPSIDIKVKDALGRKQQLSTLQLDFNLPERFDLVYIGEDGEKHRLIMLHRALLGALERFVGILIEHYAGAFPFWIAPVQAEVIPVSEKHNEYARKVRDELMRDGFRVEADDRDESVGKKIRDAEKQKVPYMLVVGDKEVEAEEVNVRDRDTDKQKAMKLGEFVELACKRIEKKD